MLSVVGVTLRTNANIAFQCAYQVVWCPKYRRKVIGGRMEQRLKEIIVEVIAEKGAWLIELETMADVAVAFVVDELVFRGHCRWCAVVGDQTLRPDAEGSLSHVGGAAVSGRVHRRAGRVWRADRCAVPGGVEHRPGTTP